MTSEKGNLLTTKTWDLCIVGGGPAGIITALEFTKLNPLKQVVLIEYGKSLKNEENGLDRSIRILDQKNHHSPEECTNKGLGGTTATWGGRCVMYDEIDFLDRSIIGDDCTWTKDLYTELRQHSKKSAEYFECGDPAFNIHEISGFRNKRISEHFVEGIVSDSIVERWSKPTRFGKRYHNELNRRQNLLVAQGYEARTFAKPTKDGNVAFLEVRKVGTDETLKVTARAFVLAAGTQETTRLLLRNKVVFNNLTAPPDALGKYYQGHLSGKISSIKFAGDPKKTNYSFIKDHEGIYVRRRLQFSKEFLIKENLLNIALWLDNPLYHDPRHRSGAMSMMYLIMLLPVLGSKLAPPAIAHSITQGKKHRITKHLLNVLKDFPRSLYVPASIFYKRYCRKRSLPGIFLYSNENKYALHFHSEQQPRQCNRMELDKDGETLLINYSLSESDVNSVIKGHERLDQYLREIGCGELEFWHPKDKLEDMIQKISRDGIHQSGTTRIADSSEKGVVDSNLKLFGTKNIYVCSSSVFPTSGQANPTFLLGNFAVRLAEHLTKSLYR